MFSGSIFPPIALNISLHPALITLKFPNMFDITSSLAPAFFKSCITFCFIVSSKFPNVTFPASSNTGSPDVNKLFIFAKLSVLCFAVCLLATVFHAGNISSIFLSKSLDTCCAKLTSTDLLPICCLSISKYSCVLPPLALTKDAILSNVLSI